jgi:hypothetical protein
MPPISVRDAAASESMPPATSSAPATPDAPSGLTDVVRDVVKQAARTPLAAERGWLHRLRTRSPLETRFITR